MKFPLAFLDRPSAHVAIAGVLAGTLAVIGCSGDDDATTTNDVRGPASCAPPSGMDCCFGDTGEGNWVCGANNATLCQDGTTLQPIANCSSQRATTYPADGSDGATEASVDAATCLAPEGMACCDGDEEETPICGADGRVTCPDPTNLVPIAACTLPGPFDAGSGPDASDAGDAIADAAHD